MSHNAPYQQARENHLHTRSVSVPDIYLIWTYFLAHGTVRVLLKSYMFSYCSQGGGSGQDCEYYTERNPERTIA